ncbi:MAG: TetR/AcrR family transcriptional regulator, partial [Solirubrobacteraceae bacterium]
RMQPPPPDASARSRRRYAPRMAPQKRREQVIDAALSVIVQHGSEGVSIEAIARMAGVTRPVIYDHFTNLGELLRALIDREEHYALAQLAEVVPDTLPEGDPVDVFTSAVRRFLDAVASRPDTWRIILLPPEGTPATVRHQVDTNRAQLLERLQEIVSWAVERAKLPAELDIEICARAIRSLSEEAGRMVLTDLTRFSPERYESFVRSIMSLILNR